MGDFNWTEWNDRLVSLADEYAATEHGKGQAERAALLSHIYAGRAARLREQESKGAAAADEVGR